MRASVSAVCASLLLCTGCSKKDEAPKQDDGKPVASASAKPTGGKAKKPNATASKFAKGETLAHMPKECSQGRLYVDVAAFAQLVGGAARGLEEAVTGSMDPKDGDATRKALGVLKAGGVDLVSSLKELAVCMKDGDDVLIAVGMDLSQVKGDPLELILKALAAAGRKDKVEKRQDGSLSYLLAEGEAEGGVIARLGSSLVVAKNLQALKLARKGGGAAAFKNATKTMAYVAMTITQGRLAGTLVDTGKDLKIVGSMQMKGKGPAAADLKAQADANLKRMKGAVDEMADELAKAPPFKDLAQPLKALKLTADGDALKAELTLPKKSVQSAIKATSELTAEELQQLMK
jgi:hypothetical protein